MKRYKFKFKGMVVPYHDYIGGAIALKALGINEKRYMCFGRTDQKHMYELLDRHLSQIVEIKFSCTNKNPTYLRKGVLHINTFLDDFQMEGIKSFSENRVVNSWDDDGEW